MSKKMDMGNDFFTAPEKLKKEKAQIKNKEIKAANKEERKNGTYTLLPKFHKALAFAKAETGKNFNILIEEALTASPEIKKHLDK